jgi:phosphoribosylanthranilate isomerase
MVKIKVCGIKNKEDALRAVSLGAWALGFIFYKKSPRYISPEVAAKIIQALPKKVVSVGVFVNETEAQISRIAKSCGLKAIQFHGDESPAFCKKFKGVMIIKAIRIKNKADFKKANNFKTDFVLFDTYQKQLFGGTGKHFDWSLLENRKGLKSKVILSGGLNQENIGKAISSVEAYAFDVSSGVEKRPGKKCYRLLKKFFHQAANSKFKSQNLKIRN